MITLTASGIDELNAIWKRLRNDFQVIETIHHDPKTLQYRMVIRQPELTKMLKGVADKVIDRQDLYEDGALSGDVTFKMFSDRIQDMNKYASLEPLHKIWPVISETDKKAVFTYMKKEMQELEEDDD
jgi:hypothetical protein